MRDEVIPRSGIGVVEDGVTQGNFAPPDRPNLLGGNVVEGEDVTLPVEQEVRLRRTLEEGPQIGLTLPQRLLGGNAGGYVAINADEADHLP
ncbi:hypothetical protein SD80_011710 [Scytonema tolypothrichoides VB-61278]|nr:hypothetical protein SD80_011710 [Scytonema tolypothrichoides VB-61278]